MKASNPIYLFYKVLHSALQGIKAEEGDKFYQSYHGRMKILRVTKKMRSSLNGMIYAPYITEFYLHKSQALLEISEHACLTCSSSIVTSKIVPHMCRSH